MIRNIIRIILFVFLLNMELATLFSIQSIEPATAAVVAIGVFVVGITILSIYTSFGPPSRELSDPFEDHED
jgi:PsbN protein